jgi:hypothetical protein
MECRSSERLGNYGAHSINILGTLLLFTYLRTMEHQPLSNHLVKLTARHVLSREYLLMPNAPLD